MAVQLKVKGVRRKELRLPIEVNIKRGRESNGEEIESLERREIMPP